MSKNGIAEIQKELRKESGSKDEPSAVYRLINKPGKNKAVIWRTFGVVVVAADGGRTDYAACKACLTVYTFKSNTGTSSLLRHVCDQETESQKEALRRGAGFMNVHFRRGKASRADKQKLTTAIANFCAVDMRPFSVVGGHGFRVMMQAALDIAVANPSGGRLLVGELIATPKTIRLNVEKRAAVGREILSGILEKHLATGEGICCTLDLWTDSVRKNSYMSITAHYVDQHFELHDRTLHVKPVRDASHTAIMVLEEFTEGLGVFNITNESVSLEQIVVVSDSGSNCCGADGIPSQFPWLACLDHKLSTCLTTVLNKTTKTVNGKRGQPFYRYQCDGQIGGARTCTAPIYHLIEGSKKLVEYFRRSNLQSKLTKTLKQENMTRWNSLLNCLKSVDEMFDEIVTLLTIKNKLGYLKDVNRMLLQELVLFLSKFQSATLSLEQFKKPTLHKVVFWQHVLIKHMKSVEMEVKNHAGNVVVPKDSSSIIALKAIILPIFIEKFKVQEIHILATILDPIMKNKLPGMGGVDRAQFNRATESLQAKMMSLRNDDSTASNGTANEQQDGDAMTAGAAGCIVTPPSALSTVPPAKRQRFTETASMYDACSSDEEEAKDEMNDNHGQLDILAIRVGVEHAAYLAYKISESEMKTVLSAVAVSLPKNSKHKAEFQVLMWWKLFGTHLFPMIARVARSVLCVSASSAKSENNFSDAGNTLTQKRSNLDPRIVNDMMFVRSNHDLCGKE